MTIKNIFEGVVERHQPRIKGLWFTKPKPTHSDSAIISCIKLHEGRLYDVVKELGADQRRRVEQIAMKHGLYDETKAKAKTGRNTGFESEKKIHLDLDALVVRRAKGESVISIARGMSVTEPVINKRFKEAGRSWRDEAKALAGRLEK